MKYRTIWIALSAFLNSNQMSSNIIKSISGPQPSPWEMLLAFQSLELANGSFQSKTDFPSTLPWPSCTGYSYFCCISEEMNLWMGDLANPHHHSTSRPDWGRLWGESASYNFWWEQGEEEATFPPMTATVRRVGLKLERFRRKPASEWSQNKGEHCWEMKKKRNPGDVIS